MVEKLTRYGLLDFLHVRLRPRGYLEIGVQHGDSLRLARCPAIGIDPYPLTTLYPNSTVVHTVTSDEFFANHEPPLISHPIDLAFIDGMHLFEYALRDFMNIEKWANQRTVVVFDDVLPYTQEMASREQCPGDWTGDVWKVFAILGSVRPDLTMVLADTFPTGALLVWNLDPMNTDLQEQYDYSVDLFKDIDKVPDYIISRDVAQDGGRAAEAACEWVEAL